MSCRLANKNSTGKSLFWFKRKVAVTRCHAELNALELAFSIVVSHNWRKFFFFWVTSDALSLVKALNDQDAVPWEAENFVVYDLSYPLLMMLSLDGEHIALVN